jgi:hypothetical protein
MRRLCYRSGQFATPDAMRDMTQDPLAASLVLLLASLTVATGLLSLAPRPWSPLGEARRLWSMALLFAPVGWMLLELGGLLQMGLLSIIAKFAISASFAVFLVAAATLRGARVRWHWVAAPVAFVLAASMWVYWREPYAPMRTGLLSLICAGVAIWIAVLSLDARSRASCRHAPWLAAAFFVSAALLTMRGIVLLAPIGSFAPDWSTGAVPSVLLGTALAVPLLATLCLLFERHDASRDTSTRRPAGP